MSAPSAIRLVIEWSPRGILAYDAATGQTTSFTPEAVLPYSGREALLALSRRSVFVRSTRVPNAGVAEVRTILQIRLGELFPIPANELAFDFELTADVNEEGRLAFVAAVPIVDLKRALAQMRASGVKVKRVVPVALGSVAIAESLSLPDATVLERLDDATSVDLISQGVLRQSRIVTSLLPLEVEINRTLALANLPCLPVVAVDLDQVEADRRTKTRSLEALANVAVDRWNFNIELPETIAARVAAESARRQRFAVLMMLAAAVLAIYAYFDRSDANDAVQIQKNGYGAKLRTVKAAQSAAEKDAAEKVVLGQAIQRGFAPAQRLSDIVTVSTNAVPAGVWVSGFTVERGKPLLIRGTAKTSSAVAAYLTALNGEPRLRDVKLVFANNAEIEKTPIVQFSISAFPVGNLPLVDAKDKGAKR